MAKPVLAALVLLLSSLPAPAEEGQTLKRIQVIPLRGPLSRLDHMAIDHQHGRLFVANMANASLDVVDLSAGRLVRQIPGQTGIQGIAYDPVRNRVFAGVGEVGVCNVFDGRDWKLVKSFPLRDADNVRYHGPTERVYVAHAEKGLAVIDARTLNLITDMRLPGAPESFQLEQKRPRLYLNTPSGSRVVAIDTSRNEVIKQYGLQRAGGNFPMALDEQNHRLYIGCRRPAMVVVLDTESGKEVAGLPIPGDTDDVFRDAARKRLYASCGAGFLAVLAEKSADQWQPAATIPTVKGARTSFFDPASGRLYLAVPKRAGSEGPEIWVYQARAQKP